MLKKYFVKALPNEANEWVRLKFISSEQKEKILSHYKEIENPKASYLAFSILGALFIGVGIISIIAHNWDSLSKISRFILGILPLVFAQIIGFYVLKNKSQSKAWVEGIGIFWFLTFGVGLAIIGQTYHLGSSLRDFYLTWMILMFPVMFLYKSEAVGILIIWLLNAWFDKTHYDGLEAKNIFLSLLALWLVYYVYKMKFHKNSRGFALLSYGLVATFLFSFHSFFSLHSFASFYAFLSMVTIFYYIDYIFFKNLSFWQKPFGIVSILVLSFLALATLATGDSAKVIEKMQEYFTIFTIISIFSLVGFIYMFVKEKIDDILYPLTPFLIWFFTLSEKLIPLYGIALAFILGFMIYKSSIKGEVVKANYAMAILIVGLFIKFAENDLGFVIQGICFIVLGICFLYMNIFIKKRKKA